MNKVYLHIGFGKTGSSSLQSYLSFNSVHQNTKEKILYCCLDRKGEVIHGEQLSQQAQNTPMKYVASVADVTEISHLNRTKEQIAQLFDAGYTPFFSQEDWGRRGGEFRRFGFLKKIACKAHIIVYVRPQIPWFNSGWWQWYAWGTQFSNPEDVINSWGYDFMRWAMQIARWSKIPEVEKITVRLHSNDIVKDCMENLGVFSLTKQADMANVSLSPMLIKLLRQFPELRSQHSADVDFILARQMDFTGKPPWVINENLARNIIDNTHKDNHFLLRYMDEATREKMCSDSQWWDTSAYTTRKVWTSKDLQLTSEECIELLNQARSKILDHNELSNEDLTLELQSKDCVKLLGKAMSEIITNGRRIAKAKRAL